MTSLWNNLVDGMGAILAFLYSVIPNYGVAIIGLTVLVRLALFPLTAKQVRSMQKMQHIQPEIKKLQAQYKNDRQKLNEEIMKFYKENKVNPMAGCLPLVFQMPVFFALYRVLRQPFAHLPTDSKLYSAFCGTEMPKACAAHPRGLSFLGVDLGRSASTIHSGFADALPYYLLIALVVATGYLQFKQSQSRQTAQANPQMAMMGKVFPVMFAFISFGLPSGVVLYFLVSNTWQIGQQALIYRTMPAPPVLPGATVPASGSTPRPTGKPAAEKPEAPVPDGPPEGRFKKALREGKEAIGKGGDQPTGNGNGDGQSKPAPKRPPVAGGGGRPAGAGDGGLGRAQPSGSPPRPKKRRR